MLVTCHLSLVIGHWSLVIGRRERLILVASVPGGACAAARGSGLDYTRWFLKIRPLVYKCFNFRRRKVLWRLGLQLFSGKWAVFGAFCRREVAFRREGEGPLRVRESTPTQRGRGTRPWPQPKGRRNHQVHQGHEEVGRQLPRIAGIPAGVPAGVKHGLA